MICGVYPAAQRREASPDEPPVHTKCGVVRPTGLNRIDPEPSTGQRRRKPWRCVSAGDNSREAAPEEPADQPKGMGRIITGGVYPAAKRRASVWETVSVWVQGSSATPVSWSNQEPRSCTWHTTDG
jgi:hypothetical protein